MGAPVHSLMALVAGALARASVRGRGVVVVVRGHEAEAREDVAQRLGRVARRVPIVAGGR